MSEFDLDIRVSEAGQASSALPNTVSQPWSNCTSCDPGCTVTVGPTCGTCYTDCGTCRTCPSECPTCHAGGENAGPLCY